MVASKLSGVELTLFRFNSHKVLHCPSSHVGILNALPLQLALCQLRAHVVRVDEWPVQRECVLRQAQLL
jgi:hypothetical protein